jgi:hypothetical protein
LLGNQKYLRDTTAEASRQSACFVQRIRQSEICEGMRATAEPPSPLHQANYAEQEKSNRGVLRLFPEGRAGTAG